jgi:hypothetical protein
MKGATMEHADNIVAAALRRAGLNAWIPEGGGTWSLPIQFLPEDSGWVELMRLRPGVRLGVLQRIATADRIADYHRHCASMGVQPRELA